jgi:mannitol/fructose-specific phosphotransferase system IIA component (Ntr-type)
MSFLKLSDLIAEDKFALLESTNSKDAVVELAGVLNKFVSPEYHKNVVDSFVWREGLKSTNIGHGIQLPHIRKSFFEDYYLIAGISREGIKTKPFQPLVRVFFMLGIPDWTAIDHLDVLAAIGRFAAKEAAGIVAQAASFGEFANALKQFGQ